MTIAKPVRPLPRDAGVTRARILASATRLFAARGFEQTGIRDIAADSQASGALAVRYFGSKEGLFRAALEAATRTELALPPNPADVGRRIAALFTAIDDAPNPLAMMLLSASHPEARAIVIEVLESRVIAPLTTYLGAPDAEARAARLQILWSGFLTAQRLLPLSAMSGAGFPGMLLWLARQTQEIVDEGRGGGDRAVASAPCRKPPGPSDGE